MEQINTPEQELCKNKFDLYTDQRLQSKKLFQWNKYNNTVGIRNLYINEGPVDIRPEQES